MSITNNNLITKLKKFRTIYQNSDPSITPETITWVWQQSTAAVAEGHRSNIINLQSEQTAVSSLTSSTINATAFPISTSSATVSKASNQVDTAANSTLNAANFQSMHEDAEPITTDTEALYRVLAIVEGRIAYNKTLLNYLVNTRYSATEKQAYLSDLLEQDFTTCLASATSNTPLISEYIKGCASDTNYYCMLRDFILSNLPSVNKHFLDQLYLMIEASLQLNNDKIQEINKTVHDSEKRKHSKKAVAGNTSKTNKAAELNESSKQTVKALSSSKNYEVVHYKEILALLKPFLSEYNDDFSRLYNELQKKKGFIFSVEDCQEKLANLLVQACNTARKLQEEIESSKFKTEFMPAIYETTAFIKAGIAKLDYTDNIQKFTIEDHPNNQSLEIANALLSLREAHSNLKKGKQLFNSCRANFEKRLVEGKQTKLSQNASISGNSESTKSSKPPSTTGTNVTASALTTSADVNSEASATNPNRPPSLSSPSTNEGKVKTGNKIVAELSSNANLAENTPASASPSPSKLSDKEALADYYFNSCSPSSASPTRISHLRTTAAGSPTTATAALSTAAATAAAASAYEPASASQPSIASSHAADQAFTPAASAHLKEAQLKGKTDTAVNTKKLSKEENEQLNFLYNRLTSTQQETLANLLRDDYNDKGNCISLSNIQSLIEGSKADGRKTGGLLGRVIETKGGSSHYCCQLPNTYQNWTIVKMRNVYGYFDIPTTKGPGLHAKDKQHIPIAAIEHARETLTRAGITKERLEMAGIKLNIGEPACKK